MKQEKNVILQLINQTLENYENVLVIFGSAIYLWSLKSKTYETYLLIK